ncbi:hypothetical protein SPRG_17138, partial [Saprolegnia parasitica CBS 223.65]
MALSTLDVAKAVCILRLATHVAMFVAARARVLRRPAARRFSSAWEKPFPSILIAKDSVSAQGSFAEAQATYLQPNMASVKELDALLAKKKLGIVAHFYMDPELQGVLSSLQWPHTLVADSLAMGEAAAVMAKNGAKAV